jgi:thiol-disulfide isomerase/thioredoxin
MPSRRHAGASALILLALSLAPHAPVRAGEDVGLYDYALTDLEGKETRLAAFRGRILVAEFFATWCPPCRKDLPEVAALQEDYPSDSVGFVAISADAVSRTTGRLPDFLREMGLKIPVLVGGEILVDRYAGVEKRGGREISLPQTYIFSGEGEILMRLVGDRKSKRKTLAEELDRILKEASSGGSPPGTPGPS